MHVLASASLGNHEGASEAAMEVAELLFPQVAQTRESFVQGSKQTLESLRGIGFKIRRADRR